MSLCPKISLQKTCRASHSPLDRAPLPQPLTSQGAKSAQARARNEAKANKGPSSQLKSNAVSVMKCGCGGREVCCSYIPYHKLQLPHLRLRALLSFPTLTPRPRSRSSATSASRPSRAPRSSLCECFLPQLFPDIRLQQHVDGKHSKMTFAQCFPKFVAA